MYCAASLGLAHLQSLFSIYIYIALFVFSFCEEWPIAEHPEKEAAMDLVEFRQKNPESLNDCVEQSVPGSLYWTSAYEK